MSKQSEAKESQGYVPKPTWPVCSTCMYFSSDKEVIPPANQWNTAYTKESNLRCSLGGFKVAKLGTCDRHDQKPIYVSDEGK